MPKYLDLRPQEIKWEGDDPKGVMTSYTRIFNKVEIGFRIMTGADGLTLVDFTRGDHHKIYTVDEGKQKAQELFNQYCDEIMKNAFSCYGSITQS